MQDRIAQRRFRQLIAVVTVAAALTPTLIAGTAIASTHQHQHPPKAHQASGSWACTLVGGVVAAGVVASFTNPGLGAITAVLAGSGFTAGCEMGAGNRTLVSGLPRNGSCWYVFQHRRNRHHRWYVRRVEECWA